MSVFQPRNRLVNFRLSEEEFERLKALCPLHGARSISDFARSSVLERLEKTPAPAPNPVPALETPTGLDSKVNALETRVDQLLNLINAVGFTNATGPQTEAPAEAHAVEQVRAD